ncbi:MAG: sigma-54 dependent transcriptional regulator [Bdellovibrionota bacterium]
MNRLIIGNSPVIQDLNKMIMKIASAKTNVLVIGESGTGKELIARTIHNSGPLKAKPFVAVNCGAIPETLMESELFGHRKGSFTGAINEKPGLFEVANGGTLFLDEVGEIPVSMQVKLLRALQEKCIRKVGGNEDIRVDVRIIAATNRDLETAVAKGTFREDLYYRLNVLLIKAPPLRVRTGDIEILARHFLADFEKKQNKKFDGFSPDAIAALQSYSWPGNIRELENVIERAGTLSSGKITLQSLPVMVAASLDSKFVSDDVHSCQTSSVSPSIVLPGPNFSDGPLDLDKILGNLEKIYLESALSHVGGIKKKAASILGITFRSIRYRLNKVGIEVRDSDTEIKKKRSQGAKKETKMKKK